MDRVSDQVNKGIWGKSIEFIAALQARGIHIHNAYLFGSHAKGYAQRGSDIDLAVISPDLSGDWLDDFCFLTRIADDIDPRIEVIPFRPKEFTDNNPLVWEVKTTGIPLLDNTKNGKRRPPKRKRAARRPAKRA